MKLCMGDSANIVKVALQHDWSKSESKALQAIAEIGVHRGATSKLLLESFPKATLYMVDSWCSHGDDSRYRKSGDGIAKLTNEQQEWNYREAVDAVSFAGVRACVIRSSAKLAARSLRDKYTKLGLVFLDGDHTYEGVKEDIAWWWPLVERGGIMAGHDIKHRRFPGVEQAVNEFMAETGLTCELMGSVWWVVKP